MGGWVHACMHVHAMPTAAASNLPAQPTHPAVLEHYTELQYDLAPLWSCRQTP